MLTGLLGRLGYDVITAEDGPAGVEMFRQRHQDLDLVILDMTMPRMSGNEALELMREIDEHVPVLISSGNANAHELNETLAQSVVGFLQKPFTLSTLSRHVANALEPKEG